MPPARRPPKVCGASRPGGRPIPDNVLVAVNLEYTHRGASVQAGDEVAFFPPVTGG